MKDVKLNARAINETCLIVNWSLNSNFRLIVGCRVSYEILLDPPSVYFLERFKKFSFHLIMFSIDNQELGQRSWILTYDKQAQEEMLCHLRPGTEYKVSIEVLDNQAHTPKSPSASVSTPSGKGVQAEPKNF